MNNELITYKQKIAESAQFLRQTFPQLATTAVVAGTGLNNLANFADIDFTISYADIPHFPTSTVSSHAGELALGFVAGKPLLIFKGRFHLYEGYTPWEATFPLRVLAACGLRTLLLTNAAGGLNLDFSAGDIMLISDQINMMGDNPLIGPHADEWGDRFPDMSQVYDLGLQDLAIKIAKEQNITLQQGVYLAIKGPSLETPAETKLYHMLGADAIGMSTVLESIVAVQCGVRILGFSVITNMNDPANMQETSLDEIVATADRASGKLAMLIKAILSKSLED